jgi:hypothetical protein
MKKLLLCSFILLQAANIFAQYSGVFISPGIAVSKPTFPIIGTFQNKAAAGFDGGIGAEFCVSKKFSVQAELNYSIQGLILLDSTYGGFLNYRKSYLTIPLLAKYYFLPGFSLFAGPQIGYLVSNRLVVHGSTSETRLDIKHLLKSTDFYIVAGVEYHFPAGLFVNLRYNLGLTDIAKGRVLILPQLPGDEYKNRYFSFRLGYSIPMTKLLKSNH